MAVIAARAVVPTNQSTPSQASYPGEKADGDTLLAHVGTERKARKTRQRRKKLSASAMAEKDRLDSVVAHFEADAGIGTRERRRRKEKRHSSRSSRSSSSSSSSSQISAATTSSANDASDTTTTTTNNRKRRSSSLSSSSSSSHVDTGGYSDDASFSASFDFLQDWSPTGSFGAPNGDASSLSSDTADLFEEEKLTAEPLVRDDLRSLAGVRVFIYAILSGETETVENFRWAVYACQLYQVCLIKIRLLV
jgi:hypothetical protein